MKINIQIEIDDTAKKVTVEQPKIVVPKISLPVEKPQIEKPKTEARKYQKRKHSYQEREVTCKYCDEPFTVSGPGTFSVCPKCKSKRSTKPVDSAIDDFDLENAEKTESFLNGEF